jgi:hypothetical protein
VDTLALLALEAGGMFELHVRELGGDGIGRVHVAERGGEDDVAAAQRHLRQHALGVRAFGHAFLPLDLDLVAEMLCTFIAATWWCWGPAAIADRADIDEAGLHLVHPLREGTAAHQRQAHGGARQQVSAFHSSPHGGGAFPAPRVAASA